MKPSFKLFLVLFALLLISACVLYVAADGDADGSVPPTPPPVAPLADDDDDDDFGDDDDDEHDIDMALREDDDHEALLKSITSHPDVEPFALLPNSQDNRLVLGKTSDILLGFKNTGDHKFTVAAIRGFIVNPPEWSFPIQNLTGFAYNVSVLPEETSTLLYRFMPSEMLAPREFGLIVDVFYTNERNSTFATTFFNQTVTLVEPEEAFGVQSLITLVTLLALVLGGGYIAYYFYAPRSLKDSVSSQLSSVGLSTAARSVRTTPSVSSGESSPDSINEDWVPKHLRTHLKKQRGKQ